MNFRILNKFFCLTISILVLTVTKSYSDDNPLSNVPPEIIDFALNFVENPSDIFFSLEQSMEDFSPLNKKWFGIRTSIFPTLFPFTLGNLSIKGRFNNETPTIPQIGIFGGYGKILALEIIKPESKDSEQSVKPESINYYYGITLSKTFEKATMFVGAKYSQSLLSVKLSSPVVLVADVKLSEINFKVEDTFYFGGISIKTSEKRTVIAQMSYGPKYKKIVARLGVEGPHTEFGIDIFPEGLIVLYPYWAYHWRF